MDDKIFKELLEILEENSETHIIYKEKNSLGKEVYYRFLQNRQNIMATIITTNTLDKEKTFNFIKYESRTVVRISALKWAFNIEEKEL